MTEILRHFDLLKNTNGGGGGGGGGGENGIRCFYLAEGPGGFIEAVLHHRNNYFLDTHIGMTLMDDNDDSIPGWGKSAAFLQKHRDNIKLEFGKDRTGNILSVDNLRHCHQLYASSMDLITADGGFDFSADFNHQEKNMLPLIFAEVCYAILLQKQHGSFVLKIFDCFLHGTIDILYILCAFYRKVVIIKPQSSRAANSEKYVVCTGFLHAHTHSFEFAIFEAFTNMIAAAAAATASNNHDLRFLKESNSPPPPRAAAAAAVLPYLFTRRMEDCNAVFGQQQLESIHQTINLIENKHKNEEIDILQRQHTRKCILWCQQHNMPVDRNFLYAASAASISAAADM